MISNKISDFPTASLTRILASCLFLFICNGISSLAGQEFQGELSQWETHRPSGARASFMLPKKPLYVERSFSPLEGKPPIKVRIFVCSALEGEITFTFSYHDLHEEPSDRQATNKALQGVVNGSVFNVLGNLLPPEEVGMPRNPLGISLDGNPGLQYVYRFSLGIKNRSSLPRRVFAVGQRIYQLNCIMIEKNYDAFIPAKFLKTIKLYDPNYDLPPETSQDDRLHPRFRELRTNHKPYWPHLCLTCIVTENRQPSLPLWLVRVFSVLYKKSRN